MTGGETNYMQIHQRPAKQTGAVLERKIFRGLEVGFLVILNYSTLVLKQTGRDSVPQLP